VADYTFEDIVTRVKRFLGDADVGSLDAVVRESVNIARDEILSRATFWFQCEYDPYVQQLSAYTSTLILPNDYVAPLGVAVKDHVDSSDSIVNHKWQRTAGVWDAEDVGWKPLQQMDIKSAMQVYETIPSSVTLTAAQAANLTTDKPIVWTDEGDKIRLCPLTDANVYVALYYYKRPPKLEGDEWDYLTQNYAGLLTYGALRDVYLWREHVDEARSMRFEYEAKLKLLLDENKARKRTLESKFAVGYADGRALTQTPRQPKGHSGW